MAKDLPPRENTLFKRIIKCYENKQYKTGLKHARQILSNSKFQEHGETLAMMGLTLNCLGRKEEAYDNVKRGLRNNLQSHVCWHVFGLLQRSDKKYEEAIKCYRNALRWDKDNLQILRDLSLLQIQTRDLEGYKMTRHQLLMLRANQRAGWVGYAIAQHILGEHDNALNVLQTFRKTQEGKPGDYEFSELLLYEASIMVEAEKHKQALNHILTNRNSILDIQSWLEMAGELYYKLGQYEESADVFEKLVHRNPENTKHLENHINAKQPCTTEVALDICEHFRALYPKADAPLNYALKHSSGSTFKAIVDGYLRRQLAKGVTPLFNILKHLFSDKSKLEIIEDLMLGYYKSLEEHQKFSPDDEDTELPTSYLHVVIFLAQLYDHNRDTKQALYYIDRATMHTPTYIDPYMVKSKIYKHAGNPLEAVTWMDEARTLDLADRYLNSKCAKYMLRAGMLDKAEETCAFFTREGQPAVDNLNEMQCMWFLTECARTYYRNNDLANTLKKCHEVEKHFVDIVEDQFDFHPYSMRKMTLRAYIGLLRLEDKIRGHNFYNKAAELAIRTYLHLHDKPLAATNGHGDGETDQMSVKEKKKLESKKKRAAKKKQQQKQEAAPKDNNQAKKTQGDGELVPPPISGEDLIKTEAPLEEAIKFLEHLRNLSPKYPATHKLAFEIYYRRGKILLMIQSLKRAMKVSPDSPEILLHLPKLCHYVKSAEITNGTVVEIVKSEIGKLLPDNNIDNWLASKLNQYNNSLKHYFMICCARAHISPDTTASQRSLVLQFELDNSDLESCQYVYEHLKTGYLDASTTELEHFAAKSHKTYPICASFSPKEVACCEDEEETVNR